jgi:hypothetical protein
MNMFKNVNEALNYLVFNAAQGPNKLLVQRALNMINEALTKQVDTTPFENEIAALKLQLLAATTNELGTERGDAAPTPTAPTRTRKKKEPDAA